MKEGRPNSRSPFSLPFTIGKKQLRILPTGYGYLFMLVLSAILLGSINYNNNLGFLLSFLLGGIAAVSILHTYKNLSGLQILSVKAKPVFANEKATFKIDVKAEAPYRMGVALAFSNHQETIRDIAAEKVQRISVPAVAARRGIYRPGKLSIFTRYPLGLFQCVARLSLDAGCLVYPKPISGLFRPGPSPLSADNGEKESERPGVDDFQGLRPYQPGDSIQHIYWKAFSREQGLHIKSFAEESGDAVMLDWNSIQGTNTEHILSRLCDMILKAHRFNLVYGLSLPGKNIPPNKGNDHRQACLKALALFGGPSEVI